MEGIEEKLHSFMAMELDNSICFSDCAAHMETRCSQSENFLSGIHTKN
jgi:hypothetical protein